jgi:two-component system aerobic respiration control sensor histidine kinase ArcB
VEDRLEILVVEDDPTYAEFVVSTLRAAGHSVTLAGDGAAARARAKETTIDAVILDLTLPDESGYDIARALRRELLAQRAVIILLTANMYPELDKAEAVGIDLVLSKPIEPALVAGMVDHVHARRRKRLTRD